MNVLSLLKKDHEAVKDLFAKFERIGSRNSDRKWALLDDIRREVMVHAKVEEEIFYPAVKAFNGEGRKLINAALKQHKEIDDLLLQIARMNPADKKFDERFAALMDDVDNHIEEEEGQIFQFAKENCPESQLDEMGVEVEKRKSAIERQLAA